MATVTSVPPESLPAPPVPSRLLTAADLAAMPEELPSGSVSYELHHGRLVPMSPPVARHGQLQARFAFVLTLHGENKGLGSVYTEVGIVLSRSPDHVLGADVAFVAKSSLPPKLSPEGYLETIPQLVVEIRSKNDTAKEVADKVADYLQAGALIVWVVEPATEKVFEHRGGQPAKTYQKSDALTCDDVIPGFHLPLAELFQQ